MKKKFIFLKNQDISSRHVNFFNIKNYSLRNRFRDLFSKLNANEYIEILKRNKFKLIKAYVEYCPIGYELLRKNPRLYERLIKKNPSIPVENYYLKPHIVYLKK